MDTIELAQVETVLDKILWGKSFAEVPTSDGIEKTFILRSLTIREVNLSNFIHNKELQNAIKVGILTNAEMDQMCRERRLWTNEDDAHLERLSRQIKFLANQVKDFEFMTLRKKKAERELASFKTRYNDMVSRRQSLFGFTAEARADEVQRRFIVYLSTENEYEQSYWADMEAFNNESDTLLIYRLALAYFQHNMFDLATIRKVARSGTWRYRWNASKHGADLFGRPISEWSEMQRSLVYWSQFYDFILESPDAPPGHIVDNDDACDAWYEDQVKKLSSTTKSNKNVLGHKTATQKKDHNEQFIMVEKGDDEAIQRIQDMNTKDTRDTLRKEREIIERKGRVKEWDLRGKRNG